MIVIIAKVNKNTIMQQMQFMNQKDRVQAKKYPRKKSQLLLEVQYLL